MSFPKYKYLLTYRYAEIIYDLTVEFCRRYIDKRSRTYDQMVQAARSGKQNIVEGIGQSQTSKKGEIKLLGVAKASLEELLADYEDFSRERKLVIWPKGDPRVMELRHTGFRLSDLSNLSDLGFLKKKAILPEETESAANFLLTLCHQATFLLTSQIKATEERFINEGGFTENLFRKRLEKRSPS